MKKKAMPAGVSPFEVGTVILLWRAHDAMFDYGGTQFRAAETARMAARRFVRCALSIS